MRRNIKIISLALVILAVVGLIIYKLSISDTKAAFSSTKYSDVTLTVTGDIYRFLLTQIESQPQLLDSSGPLTITDGIDDGDTDTTTQTSVPDDIYADKY